MEDVTKDNVALRPALCLQEGALQSKTASAHITWQARATLTERAEFLRMSRASVDDSIIRNLNAQLSSPSTTVDSSHAIVSDNRRVPISSCDSFQNRVLFPTWQARSDLLTYCAGVATSPDPDDPDHLLRMEEDHKAREQLVDERLDPYSARYFPRDSRTERLTQVVRNELLIENIVRDRTWGVIRDRCMPPIAPSIDGTSWAKPLAQWQLRSK